MVPILRRFPLLLLSLSVCLGSFGVAAPAAAVSILVEWEGVALTHFGRTPDSGLEDIDVELTGSLLFDVDHAALFGTVAYSPTGVPTSLSGFASSTGPVAEWSITLGSPATPDQAAVLGGYTGSCFAYCSFSWAESGAVSYRGAFDPQDGELSIGSDGTGTFAISGQRDRNRVGSGTITGVVTAATYTITGLAPATPIPEPGSALLFGLGLGVIAHGRRSACRRRDVSRGEQA